MNKAIPYLSDAPELLKRLFDDALAGHENDPASKKFIDSMTKATGGVRAPRTNRAKRSGSSKTQSKS